MHKTILNEEYTDEHKFINADGLYLWRNIWLPKACANATDDVKQKTKAIVFISHGFAEHCNSYYYDCLVKHLNEMNCLVVAHDHIGHGRSEGERIFVTSFNVLVRDVIDDLNNLINTYWKSDSSDKHPPVFVYGHSMGGLIAAYTALHSPELITGVILDSALLRMAPETAVWYKVYGVKVIGNIFPKLKVGSLDVNYISRDPKVIEDVQKDPLNVNTSVPAASALTMLKATEDFERRVGEFKSHALLLHGTDDKLTDVQGVHMFQKKALNCPSVSVELFDGAYHQLLRELPDVSERHLKIILNWLVARIS